eukprot:6199272-Pleurochrysis_carterae.AAC.1
MHRAHADEPAVECGVLAFLEDERRLDCRAARGVHLGTFRRREGELRAFGKHAREDDRGCLKDASVLVWDRRAEQREDGYALLP